MSLSAWLRDYLYIPLGGSRGGKLFAMRNLMLTMLLGGLWHGANWTFVIWGGLHGLALAVHRLWAESVPYTLLTGPIRRAGAWLLTSSWVLLCFALFRCQSVGDFVLLLEKLGDWSTKATTSAWLWLVFGLALLVHVLVYVYKPRIKAGVVRISDVGYGIALGAAAATSLYFTPLNPAPFIYFQF